MPLTESFKKKQFGNTEPQQERAYTDDLYLTYEGYASPGVSQDTAGWVIVKHTLNDNNLDTQSRPKIGVIWSLREIYDYDSP